MRQTARYKLPFYWKFTLGGIMDFALWYTRRKLSLYSGATCNLGQDVYTHVPLSLSSIIWYQPMGGDASTVW